MSDLATRAFFDEMAQTYDEDVTVVGWDPIALLEAWPFLADGDVLEIGCGTGTVLAHMAGDARSLSGIDLSDEMIRRATWKLGHLGARLEVASANEPLPYADDAFDTVVSLAVFEFVEDLSAGFAEVARVLRPGGRALITVEDLVDMHGRERERLERRYGLFDLHRRTRDEVEASLPRGLKLVRVGRHAAYTVVERGFTCAYWVLELTTRS